VRVCLTRVFHVTQKGKANTWKKGSQYAAGMVMYLSMCGRI
jgi:hypothetical protein